MTKTTKTLAHFLLLVTSASLLTACGQATPNTDTMTTTHSQDSSKIKEKAQTTSKGNTKPEQSTSSSNTSTQAETTAETKPAQETTATPSNSQTVTQASRQELRKLPHQGFKSEWIGKWQGSSAQARNIEMTLSADGTMTVTADFRQSDAEDADVYVQTSTAQVTHLVEYKPNHYIILDHTGDVSALLPGITGLGGLITPGFVMDNGQYKPLFVGQPMDSDESYTIDLENVSGLGHSVLSKVE